MIDSYCSGGYYVLNTVPRPNDVSTILPERLLTMSSCFASVVRNIIQLQWDDYENVREAIEEEISEFGVARDRIPELVRWAKEQRNANYNVYCNLDTPLEFVTRFAKNPSTHVVGIGLHRSLLSSFESQLEKDANRGLGLWELLKEDQPLSNGGRALGFEPLGYDATKFHSWLCHAMPEEAHRELGIRPNQFGLIDGFDDAVRVTDYLVQTGAEPVIWEPWLIVDYSPDVRNS